MGRGAGLSSWEAGRRLRREASSFHGQHSSGSWDPGCHPQTQVSFLLAAFPRAKSPVLEGMANPSTFPGQDRLTRRGYLLPSSSNLKALMCAPECTHTHMLTHHLGFGSYHPAAGTGVDASTRPMLFSWNSQPILFEIVPRPPSSPLLRCKLLISRGSNEMHLCIPPILRSHQELVE